MLPRKIKTEGGKRIDYAHISHVAAKYRLDADDADNELCRHTKFMLGPAQGGRVLAPELYACADTHGLHKTAAIDAPVAAHPLPCGQDEPRNGWKVVGIANGVAHINFRQTQAPSHSGHLIHYLGTFGITAAKRHGRERLGWQNRCRTVSQLRKISGLRSHTTVILSRNHATFSGTTRKPCQ